jgi:hypothetical protein
VGHLGNQVADQLAATCAPHVGPAVTVRDGSEGGIMRLMTAETETVTLWRPTGLEELALVEASGWRKWPPRLAGQPIFYPVLNEE